MVESRGFWIQATKKKPVGTASLTVLNPLEPLAQSFQNPLTKEYTLNHIRDPTII